MKRDLLLKLIEVEKKYNLYNRNIDGFYYLFYIRNDLCLEIEKNYPSNRRQITKKRIINLLKNVLKVFTTKPYRIPNGKNYDVLFFANPRRIFEDGKYVSIYTDYFANEIKNSITMEPTFEVSHFTPCATNHIFYIDRFYYLRELYILFFKRKNSRVKAYNEIRKIYDIILKEFNIEINIDKIASSLIKCLNSYQYTKKYFNKVIDSISPKVIVEVVYDSYECMVLNEVAKERKIPVIEMQHGITGDGHPAYNLSESTIYSIFPDYFFAFSKYWCDKTLFPNNIVKKISCGFYYHEKNVEKYKKTQNRRIILFISSPPYGKELSNLAIELNKQLNTNYDIVYKLHSFEYSSWRKWYPKLVESGIKVIDNGDISLYDLLSQTIVQVGVSSTAIYEGLSYDLQTFIYKVKDYHRLSDLVNFGLAEYINDSYDLLYKINNRCNNYKSDSIFWEKNSFENIMNEINNIIKLK